MIRLLIHEASPSLNKYSFSHWRVQQRDKLLWRDLIWYAARVVGASDAIGRRRVTVERHGKRALDPDNGAGGCKIVLDGLRYCKLLVDDTDRYCELVFRNVKLLPGEKPHSIILLEDL